MKYSKIAAVVAGSMMAVGVAAPAFADAVDTDSMTAVPTSITGGVNELTAQQPLEQIGESAHLDPALQTVGRAADHLRGDTSADALVGQGVDATRGAAASTLLGAVPGASLLGGLPLGGLGGG